MDTSTSADPLLIAAAGCTVCVLLTAAVPLVAGKTGRASFGFWMLLAGFAGAVAVLLLFSIVL